MGSQLLLTVSLAWFSISRNNLFLVRKMAKGTGRKGKAKAAAQVERAPEEDVAETNQDHTEDANVPVPSPKIKKGKKGKAVPEIVSGDGAENETVPEELKPGPSEPSPKAKKGKKKNAKNVQEEASTSDVKPAADEEAMASENKAIPEESEPSKDAVPEISGVKEAENVTVPEEPSEPSASTAKPKKGKKKNAKIVQGEASTSDVKPAADESQIVSIPKESEGDAEIASVPEPEPSPN